MNKPEIPFSFLRNWSTGNPNQFFDRQKANQSLRNHKVPIDMTGLDICISLWTLPTKQHDFNGILEDMRITTLNKTNPFLRKDNEGQDEAQISRLKSTLEYMQRHKIIRFNNKQRYFLTKKGIDIMEKARIVLSPSTNK